jgi:hypothetical protein
MLHFHTRIEAPRALFRHVVYDGVIAIFGSDEGRSLTNDANLVVKTLAGKFDLSKYRVIYRDTRGIWDEMLVRDGRFAGFASINERDLEAALVKIAK